MQSRNASVASSLLSRPFCFFGAEEQPPSVERFLGGMLIEHYPQCPRREQTDSDPPTPSRREHDQLDAVCSLLERRLEGLDGVGGFPQRRLGNALTLLDGVEDDPNGVGRSAQRRRRISPTASS